MPPRTIRHTPVEDWLSKIDQTVQLGKSVLLLFPTIYKDESTRLSKPNRRNESQEEFQESV